MLLGRRVGIVKAPSRFALLCHQRSGSNMLTSILNQHPQVIMRGQIFKDDPAYQLELRGIGMVPFTGQLFDDELASRQRFDELQESPAAREPRNTAATVESFYRGQGIHSTARTVGIKFHGGTLYDDEIEQVFLGDTPYRILLLHRQNLVAAGISWYQSRELNQWVARSGDRIQTPDLYINLPTLKDFVYRTRDDIANWKALLARHEQPYLELTYEQITSPEFNYEFVWYYLGVKVIPTPKPKTRKLIKDYSHIQNIDEIRAVFAGQDLGEV